MNAQNAEGFLAPHEEQTKTKSRIDPSLENTNIQSTVWYSPISKKLTFYKNNLLVYSRKNALSIYERITDWQFAFIHYLKLSKHILVQVKSISSSSCYEYHVTEPKASIQTPFTFEQQCKHGTSFPKRLIEECYNGQFEKARDILEIGLRKR